MIERIKEAIMSKPAINYSVILHPIFILLAFRVDFGFYERGSVVGTVVLGIIIGCLLFAVVERLRISMGYMEGLLFALCPVFLFLLTRFDIFEINLNIAIVWVLFVFVYMIMGAGLYIKSLPPKNEEDDWEDYVACFGVVFLVVFLFIQFVAMGGTRYSADSWGLYDISLRLFRDFGSITAVRQHVIFTDYNISFPYFMPMLMAVVNSLAGFSIFSGSIVNFIVALASIYFMIAISVRWVQSPLPGLIVAFMMMTNREYMDELFAARSVPMALLFALLVLYNIIPLFNAASPLQTKKHLFFAGLFAGIGMVVRFDFLAISGLLGVILVIVYIKKLHRTVPFYVLGLLVFTLPWLIYSVAQFDMLWISDNSGTLFEVSPLIPTRVYLPDEIVPTLFTDWRLWATHRVRVVTWELNGFFYMLTRPTEIFALLGIIALHLISKRKNANEEGASGIPQSVKMIGLGMLIIYSSKTLIFILTGFVQRRYHAGTILIVLLYLLCRYRSVIVNRKIWIGFASAIIFAVAAFNLQPAIIDARPRMLLPMINIAAIEPDAGTLRIRDTLMEYGGFENSRDVRLLTTDYVPWPYRFGPSTGIMVIASPDNATPERVLYLAEHKNPNFVGISHEENAWAEVLSSRFLLRQVMTSPNMFSMTTLNEFSVQATVQPAPITDETWINGVLINGTVILFEHTPENAAALEGAAGFQVGNVSIGIVQVNIFESWIHVIAEQRINLQTFAYPNHLNVLVRNSN
ncbi:MAG: hypothetical protein FWC71_07525 [Defluviitaleaceae bacterium]|nr:hypothetical protein [Defluviitaleaceae bacterium]